MFSKLKCIYFIIFTLLLCSSFMNSNAQEGAYWQGLSVKNPAVIGTPSDWIFGGYIFTNVKKLTSGIEQGPTGYAAGVDYEITPKIGSVGVNYATEKVGLERISQMEMSYAYTFPFKNGFLNTGLSVGINKYEYDLSNYHSPYASFDPLFVDGTKLQHLKTGIGLFYNSEKIDLGISTIGISN